LRYGSPGVRGAHHAEREAVLLGAIPTSWPDPPGDDRTIRNRDGGIGATRGNDQARQCEGGGWRFSRVTRRGTAVDNDEATGRTLSCAICARSLQALNAGGISTVGRAVSRSVFRQAACPLCDNGRRGRIAWLLFSYSLPTNPTPRASVQTHVYI